MKNVARDEKLVFVVNCDYPGKIKKKIHTVAVEMSSSSLRVTHRAGRRARAGLLGA